MALMRWRVGAAVLKARNAATRSALAQHSQTKERPPLRSGLQRAACLLSVDTGVEPLLDLDALDNASVPPKNVTGKLRAKASMYEARADKWGKLHESLSQHDEQRKDLERLTASCVKSLSELRDKQIQQREEIQTVAAVIRGIAPGEEALLQTGAAAEAGSGADDHLLSLSDDGLAGLLRTG